MTEADWTLIVDCLSYTGRYRDLLTPEQRKQARLLGDGFGKLDKGDPNLFDWSHIRDSSAGALNDIVIYLRALPAIEKELTA